MKPRSFWGRTVILNRRHTDARRLAWILVAAAALAVGAPALRSPVRAAGAGQIDSISPSCASVGDQVTITGRGFGAQNVSIAVGGVPAQVVAANGHSATFIVPAGAPLGKTTVTAKNPGGHTGSIAFKVCDLHMPEAWAGEWQITITYSNATTGSVTAEDNITDFIRTDEPFGLAPAVKVGNCAGSVSDTHLEIQCSGQGKISTCTLGTSVQIAADRADGTIKGSGMTTITFTSGCAPFVNVVQTIQISGQRLNLTQGPPGSSVTMVESFVPFAALIGQGQ
jgi:hypothetical protein